MHAIGGQVDRFSAGNGNVAGSFPFFERTRKKCSTPGAALKLEHHGGELSWQPPKSSVSFGMAVSITSHSTHSQNESMSRYYARLAILTESRENAGHFEYVLAAETGLMLTAST
jgi:hypothetical protein